MLTLRSPVSVKDFLPLGGLGEEYFPNSQQHPTSTVHSPSTKGCEEDDDGIELSRSTIPTPYQSHAYNSSPAQSPTNSSSQLFSPTNFSVHFTQQQQHEINTPKMKDHQQLHHRSNKFLSVPITSSMHSITGSCSPIPPSPSLLTDYRGTPIDSTMRRNMIEHTTTGEPATKIFIDAARTSLSEVIDGGVTESVRINSLASPVPLPLDEKLNLSEINHSHQHHSNHDFQTHLASPLSCSSFSSTHSSSSSIFDDSLETTSPDLLEIVESFVEEADDAVEEELEPPVTTPPIEGTLKQLQIDDAGDSQEWSQLHQQQQQHDSIEDRSMIEAVYQQSPNQSLEESAFLPTTFSSSQSLLPSPFSSSSPSRPAPPPPRRHLTQPASRVLVSMDTNKSPSPTPSVPLRSRSRSKSQSRSRSRKSRDTSASSVYSASSLPQITPPTLEEWNRMKSNHASTKTKHTTPPLPKELIRPLTSPNADAIRANLKLVKQKLSASNPKKRPVPTTTPSIGATSTTVATSKCASFGSGRSNRSLLQTLERTLDSMNGVGANESSSLVSTHSARRSASPSSSSLPFESNPWLTQSELSQRHSAAFATPKRIEATLHHTPVQPSAVTTKENTIESTVPNVERPLPLRTSLWMRQIASDRIHDNMRYFTAAYGCLDGIHVAQSDVH